MGSLVAGFLAVTVAPAQSGEKTHLLQRALRVSGVAVEAIGNPIPVAMVEQANLRGKTVATDADDTSHLKRTLRGGD
jgi:hypothetical protein